MVIGPLDKNPGELSVVCPELYYRALEGMHGEAAVSIPEPLWGFCRDAT